MEQNQPEKSGKKKGCLKALLAAIAIIGIIGCFVIWQLGAPQRDARRVRQQIQPGMTLAQVEGLITGRTYCFYQVLENGNWSTVKREEFIKMASRTTGGEAAQLRLMLTFMGAAPGRVSFYVEMDAQGKTASVSEPFGWD